MTNLSLYGFPIEREVPIPKPNRPGKYGWKKMAIGDCFTAEPGVKASSMGTQAWLAAKRTGFKFSVRTCEDGTVKIWRVA